MGAGAARAETFVLLAAATAVACVAVPGALGSSDRAEPSLPGVRVWTMHYRAHDGQIRRAFVELPAWYGPERRPKVPLVISPHGRGVPARETIRRWGTLPALGPFAVVHPVGQGRRLTLYAWGDPG